MTGNSESQKLLLRTQSPVNFNESVRDDFFDFKYSKYFLKFWKTESLYTLLAYIRIAENFYEPLENQICKM